MMFITKLLHLRVALISALLLPVFVWISVPMAMDIRAMQGNQMMVSASEITEITHLLLYSVTLLAILTFSFGMFFFIKSKHTFWERVAEKYIFHCYVYLISVCVVAIIRDNYFSSRFYLDWEFIGFTIACFIVLFQWSYSSYKNTDLKSK